MQSRADDARGVGYEVAQVTGFGACITAVTAPAQVPFGRHAGADTR